MKYLIYTASLLGLSLAFTYHIVGASAVSEEAMDLGNHAERKIVVFKKGVSEGERDMALGIARHVRIKRLTRALSADVVFFSGEEELSRVRVHPAVERIDDDVKVYASPMRRVKKETREAMEIAGHRISVNAAPGQVLPWGIDRVDGELAWPKGYTGDAIKVAVIDTGISLTHPDLAANIQGGINTRDSRKSANDDNGHGSHVAGIIGARMNGYGVVGVAPNVDLYAVKALDRRGSGYLSDVIEGIDWAIQHDIDVINMSLGTLTDVPSFRDAVTRAHEEGIVQVAAAGNTGGPVNYPAAYDKVIAVSATSLNDEIASWSNRGAEVDFASPGVSILSTYKGSSYATISGTSMAAPHIAGMAALALETPLGSYDENGNGVWDPREVYEKLKFAAMDLGLPGNDILYGFGMPNANLLTQQVTAE